MRNWKVIHVKPRAEKKLADYCKKYHIACYLPLREKLRVAQRRKIKTLIPLFPGYIFAAFDPAQRLMLLQSNLIVRILEPASPRKLLRELVMVRRALRGNPTLSSAEPLAAGTDVRILAGPFKGVEGRVTRMANAVRVVLNVEMIGQAVAVVVQRDQVEQL